MAYAAYREHPATVSVAASPRVLGKDAFHVLDVTVSCAEAACVRRSVARCAGVGVVRCGLRHGN